MDLRSPTIWAADIKDSLGEMRPDSAGGCPRLAIRARINEANEGSHQQHHQYPAFLEKGLSERDIKRMIKKNIRSYCKDLNQKTGNKLSRAERKRSIKEKTAEMVRLIAFYSDIKHIHNKYDIDLIKITNAFNEENYLNTNSEDYLTKLGHFTFLEYGWFMYQIARKEGVADFEITKEEFALKYLEGTSTKENEEMSPSEIDVLLLFRDLRPVITHVMGMAHHVVQEFGEALDAEELKTSLKKSLGSYLWNYAKKYPHHHEPTALFAGEIDQRINDLVGFGPDKMPFINPDAVVADKKSTTVCPRASHFRAGDHYNEYMKDWLSNHRGCPAPYMKLHDGSNLFNLLVMQMIEVTHIHYFEPYKKITPDE